MTSEAKAQPLDVIVVGAGIGGLATAAALRKAGHRVKIYELHANKTEVGAGLAMQSNAMRVLNWLGCERAHLKGTDMVGVNLVNALTGEDNPVQWATEEFQKEEALVGVACHRRDLHDELKRLATAADAMDERPAELFLGKKVVACDPEAGSVTLDDGEVISGDVVVGADGVRSVICSAVLQEEVQASATGWACFRCSFDATNRKDFPELAWLDAPGICFSSIGIPIPELNEWIVYLIRDKSIVNMAAFIPDTEQDSKPWAEVIDVETMRAKYTAANYHPSFLRLFDLPPTSAALRWQLRAMPLLPTWTRGRALILGDAAHATLPLLGQGAGMAIEDAAALAILLPLGTNKDEVRGRLEGWQTLRKERGEFVNVQSVAQAEPDGRGKFLKQEELRMGLISYDVVQAAEKYFAENFVA
ncbi:FAD/NAD(P)-binding domain-containing protein [Mycena kentingensis (nom. inval.)]|nr:FAD/NAD(P)-binding domain-containing protein [Mycena kentingensis (nom. inval.)]